MQAVKENRVYTITESEVDSFRKEGYDVFGDNGELIAYGVGKSVSYERYMTLTELYEKALEENARLESEVAALTEKLKKRETRKAKSADK